MNKKIFKKGLKRESIFHVHPRSSSFFLVPPRSSRGITTLPAVLVLGVMALAVAVGITAVSLTESFISQGGAQSSRALFYAEAGARDALIKIARNKNYTCSATDCYFVDFSTDGCSLLNDCAKVSVSAGTGSSGDPKIILSNGIMKASSRRVQVSIVFDGGTPSDGEITSATWSELTN
ncbi:MAG: hypothetical protein HY228_00145 [Candidatus Yonathbacteria bacterium]|nr:hypothetical protein [Candidatus Yonathbacteria bacterium]